MTEITIHNIERYLDFEKVEHMKNIRWVEPIFISAYKAYLEDNRLDQKINNSYLAQMFNSEYASQKTYSPIENINSRGEIEKVANHLVSIMMNNFSDYSIEDKNDIRDYLYYLFTEMMNNVVDHAKSPVGGYAMAQYYPNRGIIQFAIADRGVGFLKNIKLKVDAYSEEKAIKKALEKEFTASDNRLYGHERNAGVGLYAMKEILKHTGGTFAIISNDTIYKFKNENEEIIKLPTPYKGVVVSFNFYTSNATVSLDFLQTKWIKTERGEELY